MKELRDKVYFDDSISLPGDKSTGIQVGKHSAGPVTGTHEAAYPWRDITTNIVVRGVAATDPAITQIGSTGMYFFKFAANKFCQMDFHLPHDLYVPPGGNATIHFHAHWFVDGAASPTTGDVTWQWKYAYARGFNQEAFDFAQANSPLTTAKTVTATQAVGVPFQHMVAETAAVTIPGLNEPDGIICVQLMRVANPQSPVNETTSNVYLITSDIHYRSTNIGTPGKAPDFYGAAY